jgi:hypothetical protein
MTHLQHGSGRHRRKSWLRAFHKPPGEGATSENMLNVPLATPVCRRFFVRQSAGGSPASCAQADCLVMRNGAEATLRRGHARFRPFFGRERAHCLTSTSCLRDVQPPVARLLFCPSTRPRFLSPRNTISEPEAFAPKHAVFTTTLRRGAAVLPLPLSVALALQTFADAPSSTPKICAGHSGAAAVCAHAIAFPCATVHASVPHV